MAQTTITGPINNVNNDPFASKWIKFTLGQLGTDGTAGVTVAQSSDSVQTDASGDFTIDIWDNGESGTTSVLEIKIEGNRPEYVIIPQGTASIELWDLIENYQAADSSPQVPVVSDLFLEKSANLSDVADAATSRTNLGVAIGTDVQAHSAVLDATTASFTTADETKLDGIEASADVTDATNVANAGGYVAGGTDVALTDGGTGASTASAARTNLGVSSTSETLLGANNLSDVDDPAIARANLGVSSATDALLIVNNLSDVNNVATARTNLGVSSSGETLLGANNLSDVDDPAVARANLGVSSATDALLILNNLSDLDNAATARTNLSLGNVDNISAADMPISTATQAALDGKQAQSAVLDATTASYTTAEETKLAGIETGAGANDPNTLVSGDIGVTVQAHSSVLDGTTASYTTTEETKLAGIDTGAQVNNPNELETGDIGVTVQAHDTILDNTTAAFTAAYETKLNGIDTGAEVNDPTTLLDADIGSTVQAHDAVLDATTASFTTADETKLDSLSAPTSQVIVTQASDLSGALSSSVLYVIDGEIDMGTQSITVPSGGLEVRGYGLNVSKLYSTENSYTMFVDAASDAGNLFLSNITIDVSGTASKVFDLDNSGASGAVEINVTNFENCTSLGLLDAYRQFLLFNSFWNNCQDGLTFAGTWAGGASIRTFLVRNFGATGTVFTGSTSPALTFGSRLFCDGNINVPSGATVYDFEASMFTNDADFELITGQYTGAGTVIAVKSPVIDNTSTKSRHRDNNGLLNTYVGGRWYIDTGDSLATTISAPDTYVKAAGTTTEEDLQWTSSVGDNDITYDSTQTAEIQVAGSINVSAASGGSDKNITLTIRHWDDSAGAYIDLPNKAKGVSTSAGTFHNIGIIGYLVMDQNDRVELWIENNSDSVNLTVDEGSLLSISERAN